LFVNILNAQDFERGKIITLTKDSIECKIVNPKKRSEKAKLGYTELQIIDSTNNLKTFYPKEIYGFIKGTATYKSLVSKDVNIFMHLVVEGQLALYYSGYGMGDEAKYIFKRRSEKEFNVINASGSVTKIAGFNSGVNSELSYHPYNSTIPIIEKQKAFIEYFTQYFKDCPFLARKIKNEFYSRSDIVEIFNDYNKNCGKD
jgi:hypothetical protein